MRIGKLFHLTPLVDDLAAAEYFFNSVFAPLCMMRNYSSHWHRHAALYVIAETCIEPMQPLPSPEGEQATSWYRYMERFGPHVHNLAFYVDGREELIRRLTEAGVRTTDGGSPGTVFAHPKDTPGMLEFSEPTQEYSLQHMDPRFSAHWPAFRDDYWPKRHPLTLQRLSHVTVVVDDVDAGRRFYTEVLDAVALVDQPATAPDADSSFVLVGEDTVVELTHPRDPSSVIGRELATVGQCVTGVTFTIGDIARAEQHLRQHETPVATVNEHAIVLDRSRTWGVEYQFTDRSLVGDPR
jgi:catechol 2,3-dioxygenase-like lactoylglutathione lyase family enzyme